MHYSAQTLQSRTIRVLPTSCERNYRAVMCVRYNYPKRTYWTLPAADQTAQPDRNDEPF